MSGREAICSGCLKVVPEAQTHVLPFFNDSLARFVTTYRCDDCWPGALTGTRARLTASENAEEIASFAEVLAGHAVFIHEYMRGDPAPVVKALELRMLEMMESGAVRLSIGPDRPLKS
jgi:hypothetical protein